MKKVLIMALAMAGFCGCALLSKDATKEAKAADVRQLSYAASSLGTQVALIQNPAWRPAFDVAYNDLNQLVESKVVTGLLLRNILANLPVKELTSPQARIAIESATMLYDATVGDRINVENNLYVLAAATGIRDGMKVALGK